MYSAKIHTFTVNHILGLGSLPNYCLDFKLSTGKVPENLSKHNTPGDKETLYRDYNDYQIVL